MFILPHSKPGYASTLFPDRWETEFFATHAMPPFSLEAFRLLSKTVLTFKSAETPIAATLSHDRLTEASLILSDLTPHLIKATFVDVQASAMVMAQDMTAAIDDYLTDQQTILGLNG